MSTETDQAKRALRKAMKARLASLDEADVAAQSRTAQQSILSLPQYQSASRVGIYLSMPMGEARTDLLICDALGNGKRVYVPYIYSHSKPGMNAGTSKVMDMLRMSSVKEYEGLQRDSWGIPQLPHDGAEGMKNAMGGLGPSKPASTNSTPETNEDRNEDGGLDLIVVPGVAFDTQMNRMGHGAGFYDRFLTRWCEDGERKKPFLVGLCLAEQVLPNGQILMQEWDWKVDAIAVGDGRPLTSKDDA
ncbi:hypothetical protein LTR91_012116 [Friedmanniomyces endolithicus]|uniref:5-formyltetrahydrofolate cyclo-ligase n=2 Tax=Friedmanniomyces endolithicus TaxID=329885 RepID=A0AAN6FWP3_9PEZI|nr:hypothetical protein LTS09_005086 [Friedmanniomyces endolithicus]KAK0290436.1 hypothetical protein LTR35_002379 [Friedmanniomyces endolithicus]KAK0295859.1 hypothetical protein LTS00_005600 [Friedmanniomyces endolithicus]KAK0308995.1 hypothetical protein LTR01_004876 [Friedmanniomyces endolithicus]KAK0325830.1 hypothetical protein LTR82_003369 [Friedmanniomyces endolithicus]